MAALGFLLVAAVFAILRTSVIAALNRPAFPIGTLTVNTIGSFAAATTVAIAPKSWSTLLGVAALGAFTTFSTFAVEAGDLWSERRAAAVGYVAATSVLAVAAATVGLGI